MKMLQQQQNANSSLIASNEELKKQLAAKSEKCLILERKIEELENQLKF